MAKIRVLITDDHMLFRQGIRTLLSAESDIEVVGEAANAADALTLTQQLRPDMVLMDIGMPDLDGYETAARIRHEQGNANVLLVAVTCQAEDEDKKRAYESGFNLHVPKPVNLTTLCGILKLLNHEHGTQSIAARCGS